MDKTSLVFLLFGEQPGKLTISRTCPADVDLDEANGSYRAYGRIRQIGQSCPLVYEPTIKAGRRRTGTIGVFDRGNDAHLEEMLRIAIEVSIPPQDDHR